MNMQNMVSEWRLIGASLFMLSVVCLAIGEETVVASESNDVVFVATFEKRTYSVAEPIILEILISNRSAVAMSIPSGRPEWIARIGVIRDGEPVAKTAFGNAAEAQEWAANIKPITLMPGSVRRERMLVSRFFDLSEVGNYSFSVTRRLAFPGGNPVGADDPQELSLNVEPSTNFPDVWWSK